MVKDLKRKRKSISINDFADMMGVSTATISRAVNNKPGLSNELREKIRAEAVRIGYITNLQEETEESTSSNLIAVIASDICNPYYADVITAVQDELHKEEYRTVIFSSGDLVDDVISMIQTAEEIHCAGIIQITAPSERIGKTIKKCPIPTVLLNRMLKSCETDVVTLDNYEAGYGVTRYLVERGHTSIGYLKGPAVSSSSILRFDGYTRAMKNYKLPIPRQAIFEGDLSMTAGRHFASEFADLGEHRPTAMIVSNDFAAHGFVSGCLQEGIRIPEDVSVISFDNNPFSAASEVPITTVDCFAEEMGRQAARVMVERIRDPGKRKERIVMKPVLVERNSVRNLNEPQIRTRQLGVYTGKALYKL